jgi:hypothetical protein
MRTYLECVPCIINHGLNTAEKLNASESKKREMLQKIMLYLTTCTYEECPPFLVKEVYKILKASLGVEDPYAQIKSYFNMELMKFSGEFQNIVDSAENYYRKALKLAVVGNIIDFGMMHNISKEMVLKEIDEMESKNFDIDNSEELYRKLKNSNKLLYLGDNCGEIVFDTVFIKYLKKEFPHLQITFGVRGKAVMNDVTLVDACEVGLDKEVKIISNGSGAPGTILDDVSEEFRNNFFDAEVVIAKGQGNYESLNDVDRDNVYFMFMAKCSLVAKEMEVPKFSLVCKKNR